MKLTLLILAAGLMAFTPSPLRADDTKSADKPNATELREKLKNMSPQERRDYLREHPDELKALRGQRIPGGPGGPGASGAGNAEEMRKKREDFAKKLGLDPEEMKNLSPQERTAKVKEALDKKVAELEKKKADGTITDEEKTQLERMSNLKRNIGMHRPGGPGKPDGDKSDEKKPDEKK